MDAKAKLIAKKMTPAERLKACDKTLGIVLIVMLASGIQLEATSGRYARSVWAHIALGIVLTALSLWHIYLHYKRGNWFVRFAKNRNQSTRILWWVFLLTAVTGVMATVVWLAAHEHSHIGAVHGKIGFLMVIVGIIHAAGHRHRRKAAQRKEQYAQSH